MRAWMPWVFLSVFVTAWGAGPIKAFLNGGPAGMAGYNQTGRPPAPHAVLSPAFEVPSLHRLVFRDYPVEATAVDRARIGDPAYRSSRAEVARFSFNWLSATGTAILGAASDDYPVPAHSDRPRRCRSPARRSTACARRS